MTRPEDLITRPLLTFALLLGRGIDGLPSTVARWQVGPGHPHIVPHVEVPHGVPVVAVGSALHLLALHREELVDGQRGVGVVRRDEVGHRAARDAQRSADWGVLGVSDGQITILITDIKSCINLDRWKKIDPHW